MHEIPKTYNASDWEDKLYELWEKSGYFNPDIMIRDGLVDAQAEIFSIILPPPNVTGTLHIGHASMLAIEDTLVRFHRMQGKKTLWIPGTDHAAIATQSKVESLLHAETGQTRHDIGRDEFLNKVDAFAQESHDTITHQIRKMGSSIDWSREAFTLDEQRNLSVKKAFKQMYDEGIIYRGDRIVNWDPKMQTTVSDDELEHKTEMGVFYYLQYGPFVIGTARPETKFGDKYVVVHPNDTRYQEFSHGQKITVEWIHGPITATVIKDEAIDIEFGTGAMTITPWHDMTDFDIAERHNLEKEQIIDFTGHLLPVAQEYAGLSLLDARRAIIQKLQSKNLVVKIEENYEHAVAINSRGGGIIEPQIKRQWFIDVNKTFVRNGKIKTLKSVLQSAVHSGDIDILPKRFEKIYFHWINNLRDWCISRQIWYGHRIPVWYKQDEVYCDINAPEGEGWEQDSDTLDTWFSSGLWTFSTLGWGSDESQWEREKIYHPTTVLETGYDILFFWVARMILMSEFFLGESPFKTVYLHGLVKDEQGRKMSKSLGNIINPLDIIPEHGADALRLALLIGSTPGNDIKLSEEKIASYHNFTNKLWNIGRYVLTQSEESETEGNKTLTYDELVSSNSLSASDEWILHRLSQTIVAVSMHLEKYQLSLAGETLRDFTWNELADWYVEIHKIEKNDAVLRFIFESILKLWHPFMPFITEALWQHLHKKELLMVTAWPALTPNKTTSENDFEIILQSITAIRTTRALYHIDPVTKITLSYKSHSPEDVLFFRSQEAIIQKLARIDTFHPLHNDDAIPSQCAYVQIESMKLYIHLAGIINIDEEKKRLAKESDETKAYIQRISTQLHNEHFVSKAPAHIIEQNKQELSKAESKLAELQKHIANLL